MNEQLKCLIELQEIDSQIIQFNDKIESIPRRLERYSTPLNEAKASLEKFKAKSENLNKKRKAKELTLDEIQEKINKLKSRSGDIKTNKEYEAHLKEIGVFEKNMSGIEDEILVIMEEVENLSENTKGEESKVKQVEDEFKKQEKLIEEEKRALDVKIEEVRAKRKDFASRIEQETYEQYMILIKRLGGLAVVPVKNEVCLGCNTNIPPQFYNNIRKNDDIYTCYYCKRFVYYKADAPSE